MLKKNLANIITLLRIIGSLALIKYDIFDDGFLPLYTFTGITDVLDGFVARATKTTSNLGSKLDSASDLVFYSVMFSKTIPFFRKLLPKHIWYVINFIVSLRLLLYLYMGLIKKTFLSNHTIFNKMTGLCLFIMPYLLDKSYFIYYAYLTCLIALIAVIYEMIIVGKKYKECQI